MVTEKGRTVLVVDDAPDIQFMVSFFLEKNGFTVISANSGRQAMEILARKPKLSLILLDYMLPDMTAFELLDKMAEESLGEEIPVVLCSGATELTEGQLPTRVTEVLLKPFEMKKLLSMITDLDQHPKSEQPYFPEPISYNP
jgi:CheY-like chemotaxis protein